MPSIVGILSEQAVLLSLPDKRNAGMAEDKVRQKDFDLHAWSATIPMTDDMCLWLQAQNIARVEMSVLRRWESEVLDEQEADPGSYQGPKYRELMALSQMWVFAVYEFLRTWRQRAGQLMQYEDNYNKLTTQPKRDAYLKEIVDRAKDKARHATQAPALYPEHVAKIADPEFMKSVSAYKNKTADLFRELSAVRMPAAKHELPGNKGLLADTPGIGLPDRLTGTICWPVLLGDKNTVIRRRDLADKFLGLCAWHEDDETALVLAKEAKARRKRLSRGTRSYTGKARRQPENLDQYFRTPEEVARDEVSITPAPTQDRRQPRHEKYREKAEVAKSRPASSDKSVPLQEAPPEPLPYFMREVGVAPPKNAPLWVAKRRRPKNKKKQGSHVRKPHTER
jgi:hypothetical protein